MEKRVSEAMKTMEVKDCKPLWCFRVMNKSSKDWSLEYFCSDEKLFQAHCPFCFNKISCTQPIPVKQIMNMPVDDE